MMKRTLLLITLLFSAFVYVNAQGLKNLEEYKLDNGLTVILNQDNTKAEVFGYMVCKAGGKDDPEDATGMAHYMEHMLFKGTTKLGTTDWEKEKVHIDKIFELYDQLGKTTDEDQRKEIQLKINEQSIEANKYAIPNEFSNLIKQIGGTGLNANTSPDRTVFFNTFPPNQMEAWLDIYAERIMDAVFRGFQSELEVVYEEKNMYSDMFFMNMLEEFQKNFFKVHPYGQRLLIGTTDDLKNPSLTKMREFYKTWYVPNNMALILSGDFDSQSVKPMIEKAFGAWKSKKVPERKTWQEKPINGRELVEVKMSPVKMGMLGFATVPEGHKDALAIEVLNAILSNESGSGILDQLALNNELLNAQIFSYPYYDYGVSIAFFVPKIVGQSHEEAEKLILDKIALVKKGEFEDWRLDAIKKELYRNHQESMETNRYRGILLGETFAMGHDIYKLKTYPDRINKITKEDIVRVANKYYGDNYLAFFSGMGKADKEKMEKPGFKPVVSNTNAKSPYAKHFETIKPTPSTPKYIDFENDVKTSTLTDGVILYHTVNPQNDIFSLKIKFEVGEEALPMLKYATRLMSYAYTDEYSKSEIKNEFAKIGATYDVSSDDNYTTISVWGIEKDFEPALKLINGIINHPKIAQEDTKMLLEETKANRKVERSEPDEVADAAFEWVKYGERSDYLTRLTLDEIKDLQASDLVNEFKKATNYQAEVHYVGNVPDNRLVEAMRKNLTFNTNLKKGNLPVYKPIKQYNENTVVFVDKKSAVQSKIYFLANSGVTKLEQKPIVEAFNLYFGGDFSGLVLQEIREYRSLAYGAGARYALPAKPGSPSYFVGYLGTQADKTTEALDVFMGLVRKMPEKSERIPMIRSYLEQSSLTRYPGFRSLSTYIVGLKQKGFTDDPAKLFNDDYKKLKFSDISEFYQKNIRETPMVITIVGNKKMLDYKALSKYGKVVDVKEKELYRD